MENFYFITCLPAIPVSDTKPVASAQDLKPMHECPTCGNKFFTKIRLNRHRQRVHNQRVGFVGHRCDICHDCYFQRLRELLEHQITAHGFAEEFFRMTFQSTEECDAWKLKEEEDCKVRFVTKRGPRHRQDGIIVKRFVCYHSVLSKACFAYMEMATETDGKVSLVYQRAHHGHECGRSTVYYLTKREQSKVARIKLRHKQGLGIKDCKIAKKSGTIWEVKSKNKQSDMTFRVEKRVPRCRRTCTLVCAPCRACYHEYTCNCSDYTTHFNMCRHIHSVTSRCAADESTIPGATQSRTDGNSQSAKGESGSSSELNSSSPVVSKEPLDNHGLVGAWLLFGETKVFCKIEHIDEADWQRK